MKKILFGLEANIRRTTRTTTRISSSRNSVWKRTSKNSAVSCVRNNFLTNRRNNAP